MDGRGGCCIARYAGGSAYDMSKVDRIMLRFRPIAPKPAAGGSVSGASTPPQKTEAPLRTGRWKRRYVKDNKNTSRTSNKRSSSGSRSPTGRKRKATSPEENDSNGKTVSGGQAVVTLPLLSESPEPKDSPVDHSVGFVKKPEKYAPIWLNFGSQGNNNDNGQMQGYGGVGMDRTPVVMLPQPVRVVGSWVKVESVTDAWVEGYGLGRTDEEKLVNLERDICPGFVSDGLNRVRWANKAYKEMVSEGDVAEGEVAVWLVMKEDVRLPENKNTAAFTCRVRVIRSGKEKNSLILPCDVWRMDNGGFAWRLDTKAALSLGR
ncbi:PREDICTED: uncharacterized protein LOC109220578 [Nicotiana attenuata]|uniref:DUF7950 domain-containing protein n=1 Tax=Nicotiana attenuata TaxID=49451 RepID=A0A1J6KLN5_NICAT|nr:PREDICTED: uncharacterized protein LOC109220578 [Nicotiana attenuata]OIT20137.1 hypothetical protein A4A49_38961 [Nicotiana attenuata]